MLNVFVPGPNGLVRNVPADDAPVPPNAVWLDLYQPTAQEEQHVEHSLGIEVPSREEMREIESSNRLYEQNGALYLTAAIILGAAYFWSAVRFARQLSARRARQLFLASIVYLPLLLLAMVYDKLK